jgi:hypothetical protein
MNLSMNDAPQTLRCSQLRVQTNSNWVQILNFYIYSIMCNRKKCDAFNIFIIIIIIIIKKYLKQATKCFVQKFICM